jgi:Topoisomerase DNA binding C4 zinc finger
VTDFLQATLVRPQGGRSAVLPKKTVNRGWVAVSLVAILFTLASDSKWFWGIAAMFAFVSALKSYTKELQIDLKPFLASYKIADDQFGKSVALWYSRLPSQPDRELSDLQVLRNNYIQIESERKRQIDHYFQSRQELQLNDYLESIDVRTANLKGFGPNLMTTLTSFGFDTAADLIETKLLTVPGIGPVKAKQLIDWRQSKARKFQPDSKTNDSDHRRIAQINITILGNAKTTTEKMREIYKQSSHRINQIKWHLDNTDNELNLSFQRREQARVNLEFLGAPAPISTDYFAERIEALRKQRTKVHNSPLSNNPISNQPKLQKNPAVKNYVLPNSTTPHRNPSTPIPTAAPSAAPAPALSPKTAMLCPKCNSVMVRRTAKKGPNIGKDFFGCSKYPRCYGTRTV